MYIVSTRRSLQHVLRSPGRPYRYGLRRRVQAAAPRRYGGRFQVSLEHDPEVEDQVAFTLRQLVAGAGERHGAGR